MPIENFNAYWKCVESDTCLIWDNICSFVVMNNKSITFIAHTVLSRTLQNFLDRLSYHLSANVSNVLKTCWKKLCWKCWGMLKISRCVEHCVENVMVYWKPRQNFKVCWKPCKKVSRCVENHGENFKVYWKPCWKFHEYKKKFRVYWNQTGSIFQILHNFLRLYIHIYIFWE